ncbi:hypothetical protein [Nocardia sp. NPDC005366]|uniref:hypothetical protein n=1 Tax=Nocardia sp. NPDC005366 TaxID=3156878 RepID=UPI0033A38D9A
MADGASVLIADLDTERADELVRELGPRVRSLRTDVTDEDAVLDAVAAAREIGDLRGP